jgi:hypothetical protein
MLERLVQGGVVGQAVAELLQLGLVGQVAEYQEPHDLDEARMLGELLDRDAPVAEDPLLAVDEGDTALARTGIPKAGIEGDQAGAVAELGNIQGLLALGALDDRQLDGPAFKRQGRCACHLLDLHEPTG